MKADQLQTHDMAGALRVPLFAGLVTIVAVLNVVATVLSLLKA